jgi:hypothetical protein
VGLGLTSVCVQLHACVFGWCGGWYCPCTRLLWVCVKTWWVWPRVAVSLQSLILEVTCGGQVCLLLRGPGRRLVLSVVSGGRTCVTLFGQCQAAWLAVPASCKRGVFVCVCVSCGRAGCVCSSDWCVPIRSTACGCARA